MEIWRTGVGMTKCMAGRRGSEFPDRMINQVQGLFTKLCGVQTGSVAFLSSYITECLCRLFGEEETKK